VRVRCAGPGASGGEDTRTPRRSPNPWPARHHAGTAHEAGASDDRPRRPDRRGATGPRRERRGPRACRRGPADPAGRPGRGDGARGALRHLRGVQLAVRLVRLDRRRDRRRLLRHRGAPRRRGAAHRPAPRLVRAGLRGRRTRLRCVGASGFGLAAPDTDRGQPRSPSSAVERRNAAVARPTGPRRRAARSSRVSTSSTKPGDVTVEAAAPAARASRRCRPAELGP
jgi:hypothetical protein